MRSAIARRRELEALTIPSAVELSRVGARTWDHAALPIRLVPGPGGIAIGHDPRIQIMARFTAPASLQTDEMQLVMMTHFDPRSVPSLVKVVAAGFRLASENDPDAVSDQNARCEAPTTTLSTLRCSHHLERSAQSDGQKPGRMRCGWLRSATH
jgi:hypothetical protein